MLLSLVWVKRGKAGSSGSSGKKEETLEAVEPVEKKRPILISSAAPPVAGSQIPF